MPTPRWTIVRALSQSVTSRRTRRCRPRSSTIRSSRSRAHQPRGRSMSGSSTTSRRSTSRAPARRCRGGQATTRGVLTRGSKHSAGPGRWVSGVIPKSTRPSATSSFTRPAPSGTTWTPTSGCSSRNRRIVWHTSMVGGVATVAMRTDPRSSPWPSATASRARSASCSAARAGSRKARPASVSSAPCRPRMNSSVPSSCSSARSDADKLDCTMYSRVAARVNEPSSTTARKHSSCLSSTIGERAGSLLGSSSILPSATDGGDGTASAEALGPGAPGDGSGGQQRAHGGLEGPLRVPVGLGARRLVQGGGHGLAVLVAIDDPWVDVAGLAHCRRVAELFRDPHVGVADRPLPGGAARRCRLLGQGGGHQDRGGPGPEVLRGDLRTADLLQVGVDLVTGDITPRPVVELVGQQVLPRVGRPCQELADDGRRRPVGDLHLAIDAALGGVGPERAFPANVHVLPAQRGQAEGAVLLRVLLAADAEGAEVQQPDGGGEHSFPVQSAGTQGCGHGVPYVGKLLGDLQHALVLLGVPPGPPRVVVAVLPAAGGVDTGGLDVPVRPGTDPDVAPGRRDREATDPVEAVVLDQGVVLVVVGEAAPGAPASVTRPVHVAAPQSHARRDGQRRRSSNGDAPASPVRGALSAGRPGRRAR